MKNYLNRFGLLLMAGLLFVACDSKGQSATKDAPKAAAITGNTYEVAKSKEAWKKN